MEIQAINKLQQSVNQLTLASPPPQQNRSLPSRSATRRRRKKIAKVRASNLMKVASGTGMKFTPDHEVGETARIPVLPANPEAYCRMIINPGGGIYSRYPNGDNIATAMVHSEEVFNVSVHFSTPGDPDDGRFSIFVQPIIGGTDVLEHWQNLVVNSSAGWPNTNFANPANYVPEIGNRNLQLDPFFAPLTQPPLGHISFNGPGGTASFFGGPAAVELNDSFGLPITVTAVGTTDYFQLSVGTYLIMLDVSYPGPAAALLTMTFPNGSHVIQNQRATPAFPATLNEAYTILIEVVDSIGQVFALTNNSGFTGQTVDMITIVRAYGYEFTTLIDNGLFQNGAPLAMSCLATCIQPQMFAGGNVAACHVPRGTIDKFYLNDNVTMDYGQYQNFGNLAMATGNFNGPFDNGAYAIWAPAGVQDVELRTASEMNKFDYGGIIISGQLNPGTTTSVAGDYAAIRVELHRIWMFQTDSQFLLSEEQDGSQATVDFIKSCIRGVPHAMENKVHLEHIKEIIRKIRTMGGRAYQFYTNNKSIIDPVISAGMAGLAAL